MMRDLAGQAIVLLKNDGGILPLVPTAHGREIKTIAVIGPNAKAKLVSGGGLASLKASYFITPYQGIVNALKGSNVKVLYSEGTRGV
jgi:beta-glucosidase